MNNTTLTYLLVFGIIGMVLIVVLNFTGISQNSITTEKYINPNQVRGIDVVHAGKLWTLNFDQQNKLLSLLNGSSPIEGHFNPQKFDFEKIIVYLFNRPDLIITPIHTIDNSLIFSAPEWKSNSDFKESKPGEIQKLLSSTYDH